MPRYETFNNAILLHHAFAEPAPDYKKKQHIFRLRTANLGEYLFQTTSAAEVEDWVVQINFACARFSSRALPPPACSGGAFSRARLPKLPSSAPLAQQLRVRVTLATFPYISIAHECAACELREQLSRVRQEAPPLKAKGRPVEEFFFKERYLTQEILRYDTYCHLLRSRLPGGGCELGGAPSDSTSGVHSKSDIADDLDKMSYREALNHH
ncbi:unnamed protein product [Strongylus vulgaris]|uniref:PH domain-containing protein n=1 Tax=Strongylus vulgaris TaxID=40348 RepID=A0A3P7I921_STRVU|nr:unnamed protein product [Strongylus vulgaris]